jgi:hypothetical protein
MVEDMSRPEPTIIAEVDLPNGQLWQITLADTVYIVTYQGQPVGLRVTEGMGNFKYKKMSYTNLGSARRQARLLNHRFNCEDFEVMRMA